MILFVYDFPHRKSVEGMIECLRLKDMGLIAIEAVIAAPKVHLDIPSRFIRLGNEGSRFAHPKEIASFSGIPYIRCPHNESLDIIKETGADSGLILGARILSKQITNELPIINIHPGVMPRNRGLDTIEWAVYHGLPQGIGVHIVDPGIDKGRWLYNEIVDVYPADSWFHISDRIMHKQIDTIEKAIRWNSGSSRLKPGIYHSYMPVEIQIETLNLFEKYKQNYNDIVKIHEAYFGLNLETTCQ